MSFEDIGIPQAIADLDAWFDTMRCDQGYGGPVSHWWGNSLQYTGAGLDWRYEGIIIGYLNLYEKTNNKIWLKKATRAGYDLVNGQLSHGNFRNSSFEMNPKNGGTPHEAAADVGLLRLAEALKKEGDGVYKMFLETAKRNIEGYYIERLWDKRMFRDRISYPSFVPNKAATLVEALFLLAELTKKSKLISEYIIPTVDLILKHQDLDKGSKGYGGIYQMSTYGKDLQLVEKIFLFYTARCIPAVIKAYEVTKKEAYLDAAKIAVKFLDRTKYEDGSFSQVVYKSKTARNPQWIAGVGDILRVFYLMSNYGTDIDFKNHLRWMLKGQDDCGGFRTAYGFAVQTSLRKYEGSSDFRDVLHVCGWNDKAFRFFTEIFSENSEIPRSEIKEFKIKCTFTNKELTFFEDEKSVRLQDEKTKRGIYTWRKGEAWAELDIKYFM